jgi:hypothetical protein
MSNKMTKKRELDAVSSNNDDFYRQKYHVCRHRLREQEQLCSDQVQINRRALLNQLELKNLNKVMQVRINDLEMVCSNKDAMVTKSDAMATKAHK